MKARGVHAGNFMLAANILLSGNNYNKVALLCRFMNIGVVSESLFHIIQALYFCNAINTYWNEKLDQTHAKMKDKEIVICGKFKVPFINIVDDGCDVTVSAFYR